MQPNTSRTSRTSRTHSDRGATSVEYGLLVTLLAAAVVAGLALLAPALGKAFGGVTSVAAAGEVAIPDAVAGEGSDSVGGGPGGGGGEPDGEVDGPGSGDSGDHCGPSGGAEGVGPYVVTALGASVEFGTPVWSCETYIRDGVQVQRGWLYPFQVLSAPETAVVQIAGTISYTDAHGVSTGSTSFSWVPVSATEPEKSTYGQAKLVAPSLCGAVIGCMNPSSATPYLEPEPLLNGQVMAEFTQLKIRVIDGGRFKSASVDAASLPFATLN